MVSRDLPDLLGKTACRAKTVSRDLPALLGKTVRLD
jgi:hypothetical protein